MHAVVFFQTTFLQTRVGLLTLLCNWLTDCSVAVAHFLDNKAAVSFVSFLLETANFCVFPF